MNKKAIYIFTCNRPKKLKKIVNEVSSISGEYGIHIIDDSSNADFIKENQKITKKSNSVNYLGRTQFLDFYNIKDAISDYQLLGDETWNLGIARNFALDHSIFWGNNKALFVDDDISGVDQRIIEEGFAALTGHNFVSCFLKGVEDDSIVGHIAKQVGIKVEGPKMLSGGFLFLSPTSISNRFFNIYNEDWILQILEKNMEHVIIPFSVNHSVNQKAELTIDRAVFQEFGEIVVNGLLQNYQALSLGHSFWNNEIEKRVRFINKINKYSLDSGNHLAQEICFGLLEWIGQINGESLQKFFNRKFPQWYYSERFNNQ